eukprot:Sdes_comp16093_c0_seq1m5306
MIQKSFLPTFCLSSVLVHLLIGLVCGAPESVRLYPLGYQTFFTKVGLGERGEEFSLIVDTGSSDAWTTSTYCTGPAEVCGKHLLDCKDPSTGCQLTDPKNFATRDGSKYMKIQYELGSAEANVVTLKSQLGDYQCKQTTWGALYKSTGLFGEDDFDGILGLGRPQTLFVWDAQGPKMTPFQKLLASHQLPMIFALRYKKPYGELVLGGYQQYHFKPPLTYVSVIDPNLWMVALTSVDMGSSRITSYGYAFIDSGHTWFMAPQQQFDQMAKLVNAHYNPAFKAWLVDCNPPTPYPNLYLSFGSAKFTFKPQHYIYTLIPNTCVFAFTRGPPDSKLWIMGTFFFNRVYVVFNFDGPSIGLATGI